MACTTHTYVHVVHTKRLLADVFVPTLLGSRGSVLSEGGSGLDTGLGSTGSCLASLDCSSLDLRCTVLGSLDGGLGGHAGAYYAGLHSLETHRSE